MLRINSGINPWICCELIKLGLGQIKSAFSTNANIKTPLRLRDRIKCFSLGLAFVIPVINIILFLTWRFFASKKRVNLPTTVIKPSKTLVKTEQKSSKHLFLRLPKVLQIETVNFLDEQSVINMKLTNKKINTICKDKTVKINPDKILRNVNLLRPVLEEIKNSSASGMSRGYGICLRLSASGNLYVVQAPDMSDRVVRNKIKPLYRVWITGDLHNWDKKSESPFKLNNKMQKHYPPVSAGLLDKAKKMCFELNKLAIGAQHCVVEHKLDDSSRCPKWLEILNDINTYSSETLYQLYESHQ